MCDKECPDCEGGGMEISEETTLPTEEFCHRCNGEGWISHDAHCPACDGTGEAGDDPFYIGADLLYDEIKDREMDN